MLCLLLLNSIWKTIQLRTSMNLLPVLQSNLRQNWEKSVHWSDTPYLMLQKASVGVPFYKYYGVLAGFSAFKKHVSFGLVTVLTDNDKNFWQIRVMLRAAKLFRLGLTKTCRPKSWKAYYWPRPRPTSWKRRANNVLVINLMLAIYGQFVKTSINRLLDLIWQLKIF